MHSTEQGYRWLLRTVHRAIILHDMLLAASCARSGLR